MELKKMVEISNLLDVYGSLLTQKQFDLMNQYFNEDMSLGEIGENLSISRQAIFDTLKRSQTLLYEYEEKLGFLKTLESKHNGIRKIINDLDELKYNYICNQNSEAYKDKTDEMLIKIDTIINSCEELSE